jgi:4,5-DOPA dioxygenase extradiol
MNTNALNHLTSTFAPTPRMPVLFVGHGNPMNAITENEYVTGFRQMAEKLPRPNAILCISAHWETRGTQVTAMEHPKTIHDFGGFPRELFEVQYPAPGSPALAQQTKDLITSTDVALDTQWGLDHGAWSVIKHFYPNADVPVVELSLDQTQAPQYHYDLAKQLTPLREKGVLIIGSGNMVHNLRMVAWNRLDRPFGFDWALEARAKMNSLILAGNHRPLIDFHSQGRSFDLAIPTPEHYLPLLYTLALQQSDETVQLFNDSPVGGSLSMTSVYIG